MLKTKIIVTSGLLVLMMANVAVSATYNSVNYIHIKPTEILRTSAPKNGEIIPRNGPLIKVYSRDGKKYHFVGNSNEKLKYSVQVKAACKRGRRIRGVEIAVKNGFQKFPYNGNNKTYSSSWKTLMALVPYQNPKIGRSPQSACNLELNKRLAQGKSLYSLMSRGFVVKYAQAYKVTFTYTCTNRPGLSIPYKRRNTHVDAWISCKPSPHAKKPGSSTRAGPAPSRNKPKPTRAGPRPTRAGLPLKLGAQIKVLKNKQSGKCPHWYNFKGQFKVNKAGTLNYAFVGEKGYKTNPIKYKFKKAGVKKVFLKRKLTGIKRAGSSTNLRVIASRKYYKGWVSLKYNFSTKPNQWNVIKISPKAKFSGKCE